MWAVGDLIEHWDGSPWRIADQAPPLSYLAAVSGTSPSDVWAVGQSLVGRSHHPLTEHYNGVHWTVVSSRSPDHKFNHFPAVSAVWPTRSPQPERTEVAARSRGSEAAVGTPTPFVGT